MAKHYLVLPLDDGDEGVIFDALQMYAEGVLSGPDGPLSKQANRICAELGWYEDCNKTQAHGAGVEIFHVTAYVSGSDPRPPDEPEQRHTVHHVEVMPGDCIDVAWADGETMSEIIIKDEFEMTVYPMPIEGGESLEAVQIKLVSDK
jgi:hypothetical protein